MISSSIRSPRPSQVCPLLQDSLFENSIEDTIPSSARNSTFRNKIIYSPRIQPRGNIIPEMNIQSGAVTTLNSAQSKRQFCVTPISATLTSALTSSRKWKKDGLNLNVNSVNSIEDLNSDLGMNSRSCISGIQSSNQRSPNSKTIDDKNREMFQ